MKISYSFRAFVIYLAILGGLIWFTLENAVERLNDGMRQSAESVLVDTSHILSALIESNLEKNSTEPPVDQLKNIFNEVDSRTLDAQIYQINKQNIDSQVYVTDKSGIVIYDSSGLHEGEDFSKWRDVRLTLEGSYGARSSFIDQSKVEPEDPKAMVIAAPIKQDSNIIGVVSLVSPISSLERHLSAETVQLQRYGFALFVLAMFVGYILSLWFTSSLNKIARYATSMAEGKQVEAPVLADTRLADLTESISYLRSQLDGKEYVENYIHSLTHELKTPITSIGGAVELIDDSMSAEDRALFLNNISTSNQRMSRLVDRMLSLAKLEGLTELVATTEFDIVPTINRLAQERSPMINARQIRLELPSITHCECIGDKVLISQAVANLMDNAIGFCETGGLVELNVEKQGDQIMVTVFNQGEPIPDFALAKLYERFFSLPRPDQERQSTKSTGLGLSFVKEIMKLHNGKVDIKNTHGGVLATLQWKN